MAKRKRRLPKSIRVHIRREKSRIRALVSDTTEAKEKIRELTEKIAKPYLKKEKS